MSHHTEHGRSSLVSVVIPAYNVEEYVGDAIRSVFEQTYRNIEIICVDDGSTDGTLNVMRELEEKSPFPFTIVSTRNQGAPTARNKGLVLCEGEWVQFLDSDDLLKPEKIERQVEDIARRGGQVDVHITSFEQINLDGTTKIKNVREDADPLLELFYGRAGITTSMLWRTLKVRDVGAWNPEQQSSDEMELLFRAMKAQAMVALLDEQHCVIRKRQGSITTANCDRTITWFVRLRVDILRYMKTHRNDILSDDVRKTMLRRLRQMHRIDRKMSATLYRDSLGRFYVPPLNRVQDVAYALVLLLVGFNLAERIRTTAT
jgi:glycosyltransferase involved in cell wall biosynthesis